ncbi:MAG: hypothetical protein CL920_13890 [Deltaproteobacteria bacterium]|nr:hypothetical protein [Deltaproteobacteria bacterium]
MSKTAQAATNSRMRLGWRVVFVLCMLGVSIWGVSRIEFREDLLSMLPQHDPVLTDVKDTLRRFRVMKRLLIHLRTPSSQPAKPQSLINVADRLATALKQSNVFQRVMYRVEMTDALALQRELWRQRAVLFTGTQLTEWSAQSADQMAEHAVAGVLQQLRLPSGLMVKRQLLRDPFQWRKALTTKLKALGAGFSIHPHLGYWFSKDKRHLLILAEPTVDTTRTAALGSFLKQLSGIFADAKRVHPDVSIDSIGGHRGTHDNSSQIKRDVALTVSLSLFAIVLLFLLVFRQPLLLFVALLPPVFGGVVAVALLGLWKQQMSAIPLAFGSILLGIAVDYGIHLCVHFEQHEGSVKVLVRRLLPILLLAALTSMAAFGCLLFAEFRAQHTVGVFAALSLGAALFFTLFLLPPLLERIGKAERLPFVSVKSFAHKLTRWRDSHATWIWGVVFVLTLGSLWGLSRVGFEGDVYALQALAADTKRAEARFRRVWGDPRGSMQVVVKGDSLQEALFANDLVYRHLQRLQAQKKLKWFSSIAPLWPSQDTRSRRMKRWRRFWSKARLKSLQEAFAKASKKYGFHPNTFAPVLSDIKASTVSMPSIRASSRLGKLFLSERVQREAGAFYILTLIRPYEGTSASQLSTLIRQEYPDASVLSSRQLVEHVMSWVQRDVRVIAWVALFVVCLVVFLRCLHLDLVFATIVPLLLAFLWTLGLMGWLGISFNLLNVVVSIFVLGLGVDFSLFFMKQSIHDLYTGEQEVENAMTSVLISAMTTIFGMGTLVFARHPLLYSVGVVALIGIVSVLCATMMLTPMLTRFVVKKGKIGGPMSFKRWVVSLVGLGWFFGWLLLSFFALPLLWLAHKLFPGVPKRLRGLMRMVSDLLIVYFPSGRRRWIELDTSPEKPAILVANHQSMADIPMALRLSYDLRMVVKRWVWDMPVMGPLVRLSEMILVPDSPEDGDPADVIQHAKEALDASSSIMIFPEGTRSLYGDIGRFHSGAFRLAVETGADILPVVFYNTRSCFRRGTVRVGEFSFIAQIGPRITADEQEVYSSHRKLRKHVQAVIKETYEDVSQEFVRWLPAVSRLEVLRQYAYIGPYVEQYAYWKLRIDPFPTFIEPYIPKACSILDLGCGYGFLAHYLHLRRRERTIFGVDYDAGKIEVAQASANDVEALSFARRDLRSWTSEETYDVVMLIDILHYWERELQDEILRRAIAAVRPGGLFILRDTDPDTGHDKVNGWTERFSTFFGFNQAQGEIRFRSAKEIEVFLEARGFVVRRLEDELSHMTGNVTLLCKKQ